MAALPKIAQLQMRKRCLVTQNDLLREGLKFHCENLQSTAAWVEQGYALVQKAADHWPVGVFSAGAKSESRWIKLARLVFFR